MPTPGGLPKPGEIWSRTTKFPPRDRHATWETHTTVFRVVERSRGDYWSMRVVILSINGEATSGADRAPQLWVDCAYWYSRGELQFVRMA